MAKGTGSTNFRKTWWTPDSIYLHLCRLLSGFSPIAVPQASSAFFMLCYRYAYSLIGLRDRPNSHYVEFMSSSCRICFRCIRLQVMLDSDSLPTIHMSLTEVLDIKFSTWPWRLRTQKFKPALKMCPPKVHPNSCLESLPILCLSFVR